MSYFCHSVPGWMSLEEIEVIKQMADRVKPETVVEIGSFIGRSATAWAEFLPGATIWCVDPWEGKVRDHNAWETIAPPPSKEEMEVPLYELFQKYTEGFPNIRRLRTTSDRLMFHWLFRETMNGGHPNLVNLVFIDGDHSEGAVLRDLGVAFRLTQGKGVIAGHDYTHLCGVKAVVDAWSAEHDQEFTLKLYPGTLMFEFEPRGWLSRH